MDTQNETPEAAVAESPVPDSRQQAAVIAAVSRLRGVGTLHLTFCERSPNPYASDDDSLIDIYVDTDGNEYWFDPTADRLVQMGPHARQHQTSLQAEPAARLSVARLREIALALAGKAVPDFFTRREHLHPLEDNQRARVYFFRWDDFAAPVRESEMPPFLQIALYADGRLASFTNTLR